MKKNFFIPLFWKFTISILLIVALFGSINIYLIRNSVYSSLENELENRGLFISKSIASRAVNPLLYDDITSLYELVGGANKIDTSIAYVFILNNKSKIVAHSFPSNVPPALKNVNQLQNGNKENVILIQPRQDEERLIRDIAVPILEGKVGVVRVGLYEKNIRKNIRATTNAMLLMIVIFLFAGIFVAFVFSYIITQPIKEISGISEKINIETFKKEKQHKPTYTVTALSRIGKYFSIKDELDILVVKFSNMLHRLERTYNELGNIQASILQSEKLASIGTLASGVAHEINNPITGLKNCIRRISQKPDNIQQNRKYLEMMDEATDKIEKVVQGLLNFTRKHDMKLQEVEIIPIIEKSLSLASHKIEKQNISIVQNYPEKIPSIKGSSNHLEQVLLNLILNSMDAISEKNTAQPPDCSKGIITLNIQQENDKLLLKVIDNGIGIPSNKIHKIFDPFFTSKKVEQGTGLGLSISYNIMKEHEGEIAVESVVNQGTIFTLTLPLWNMKK